MSARISSSRTHTSVFEVTSPFSVMPGVHGTRPSDVYRSSASSYVNRGPRSSSLTRVPNIGGTSRPSSRSYLNSNSTAAKPQISGRRPLPDGPGPLDARGRKLTTGYSPTYGNTKDYKPRNTDSGIFHGNGPVKADYSTSYTSSYKAGNDYNSSHTNLNYATTTTLPRKPSRSSSISSLGEKTSSLKLHDEDEPLPTRRSRKSEEESVGKLSRRDSLDNDLKSTNGRRNSTDHDFFSKNFSHSSTVSNGSLKDRHSPELNGYLDSDTYSYERSSISNKYKDGGKCGLRNLGNTCFMNSVIQCLSNTQPLLEYLLNEEYMSERNTSTSSMKGQLITEFAKLINSMWKGTEMTVNPASLKTQIQRYAPRFTGYAQQDSQEFLRYLLEGLHEDVNRVRSKPKPVTIKDEDYPRDNEKAKKYWEVYLSYDNSRIVEIFVGQLKSELKFKDCGHSSTTFDPFWDLSVPIPKRGDVSLSQCINLFMKEEELDQDERPTCEMCKKRKACTKSFSIQRFPQILVFHLKRFSQSRFSQKVNTCVDFPNTLDMSEYSADKGKGPIKYHLYGVSNHIGGVYSGHYTAYCKHPFSGQWNSFNDARASSMNSRDVISSEAYLLFYQLASPRGAKL